jgi:hypothetical protein
MSNRHAAARNAANKYAPRPAISQVMYVVVAILALAVGMVVVSRFYSFALGRYPIAIVVLIAVTTVGALWLRKTRMKAHNVAMGEEIKRGDPSPGGNEKESG